MLNYSKGTLNHLQTKTSPDPKPQLPKLETHQIDDLLNFVSIG